MLWFVSALTFNGMEGSSAAQLDYTCMMQEILRKYLNMEVSSFTIAHMSDLIDVFSLTNQTSLNSSTVPGTRTINGRLEKLAQPGGESVQSNHTCGSSGLIELVHQVMYQLISLPIEVFTFYMYEWKILKANGCAVVFDIWLISIETRQART